MAEVNTLLLRGVCGNFRFKFYQITNAATTNSVFNTDMQMVHCAFSTQTTDKADSWKCKTLNWTGTADSDTANEIKDTSETYVKALTGSQAFNTTDNRTCTTVEYKDADELYTYKSQAAYDLCPDGNEAYRILDERKIMLTPVTANDDGFVIVMGK